jgi:uncharacterized membrane protein YphA (DoxX/SURF4 family)
MSSNLTVIIILGFIALLDALLYFFVPSKRKYAAIFARIIIGLVFVFSGFVKAVDPLGAAYKIHDYLVSFNFTWLLSASLVFGVLMNLAEFLIGFVVLFGVRMRLFAWGTLLFMAFFTPLTFYLAIKNPVHDCGCFGDFLVMTNWETFYKNLVFITFAIIVFSYRTRFYDRMIPNWAKNFIIFFGVVIGLGIQGYALRYDALIDFRPWKIGNRIADLVVPTMEKSEIKLAYKNNKTGKEELYTAETLPWEDSLRMANLTFVEQRKTVIQPFVEAPIHDFIITSQMGEILTDQVMNIPNYHFLVIAYDLSATHKKAFESLNTFAQNCIKDSTSFVCITGSTPNEVEKFTKEVKPKFPIYSADPTALKTIIRSNPGILLLRNGYIMDKWAHRKMIIYETFKSSIKDYDAKYIKFSALGTSKK